MAEKPPGFAIMTAHVEQRLLVEALEFFGLRPKVSALVAQVLCERDMPVPVERHASNYAIDPAKLEIYLRALAAELRECEASQGSSFPIVWAAFQVIGKIGLHRKYFLPPGTRWKNPRLEERESWGDLSTIWRLDAMAAHMRADELLNPL